MRKGSAGVREDRERRQALERARPGDPSVDRSEKAAVCRRHDVIGRVAGERELIERERRDRNERPGRTVVGALVEVIGARGPRDTGRARVVGDVRHVTADEPVAVRLPPAGRRGVGRGVGRGRGATVGLRRARRIEAASARPARRTPGVGASARRNAGRQEPSASHPFHFRLLKPRTDTQSPPTRAGVSSHSADGSGKTAHRIASGSSEQGWPRSSLTPCLRSSARSSPATSTRCTE